MMDFYSMFSQPMIDECFRVDSDEFRSIDAVSFDQFDDNDHDQMMFFRSMLFDEIMMKMLLALYSFINELS